MSWSSCSKTCGGGDSQYRFRHCDSPAPGPGGKFCQGNPGNVETKKCGSDPCPWRVPGQSPVKSLWNEFVPGFSEI